MYSKLLHKLKEEKMNKEYINCENHKKSRNCLFFYKFKVNVNATFCVSSLELCMLQSSRELTQNVAFGKRETQ